MKLNTAQAIGISLLLTGFYLIPALNEWISLGMPMDNVLLISGPIWLGFFYLGPFWVYYFLQLNKTIQQLHISLRGLLFVGLMTFGIWCVNLIHGPFFPHFELSSFQQFFSALLWGVFYFTLWESLGLYERFNKEKALREQMRLLHLNNQLNPHFLFNSLNTISALMFQNPEKADTVLHKFADILRYAVDTKDKLIDLNTELEISRFYLDVEKARFGENLQVDWQVQHGVSDFKVPPLLIQPLLENSLKYSNVKSLHIQVKVTEHNGKLRITISDNGKGFSQQVLSGQDSGVGLALIKERLEILNIGALTLSNNKGAVNQLELNGAC